MSCIEAIIGFMLARLAWRIACGLCVLAWLDYWLRSSVLAGLFSGLNRLFVRLGLCGSLAGYMARRIDGLGCSVWRLGCFWLATGERGKRLVK